MAPVSGALQMAHTHPITNLPMQSLHNTTKNALSVMINTTVSTKDLESLIIEISDNKEAIAEALTIIGLTDSEPALEAAHMGLWHVCPTELEDHIISACGAYIALIADAWQNYNEDCLAAINGWLEDQGHTTKKGGKKAKKGSLPTEPSTADIEHLKKCFQM